MLRHGFLDFLLELASAGKVRVVAWAAERLDAVLAERRTYPERAYSVDMLVQRFAMSPTALAKAFKTIAKLP